MADYIYTMETRLTPEQLRAVNLVQDIARAQEINVYLTGGAIRDLITGLPIRDLDFTLQGNPLKLQKELERNGVSIQGVDDDLKVLYVTLPGNVRAEISMARSETYDKPGKPPRVASATINEDLRRRDFTVNAMALSLNPGSRGLLLDPFNGVADAEAKVIRILHNYAFYEDPSRLIRATRFAARFHWPLEERTQARYDAAKENNYIEYIGNRAVGYEIEALAYEDDPLHIMRALEKEGWLHVLNSHWSTSKVDTTGLAQLVKIKQQMQELGYSPDTAPAVLYFLTRRLNDKDVSDIRRLIPRKDLVDRWKHLEDDAKDLAKRLNSKEAATPSRTWVLLSHAAAETILFLLLTGKQQAVTQKINNFLTKWRQVKQKLPTPEMIELRITPAMPEYEKIANDVFLMMLDGKLRSHTELMKYLKPLAPPPPPPPPPAPTKRGRKAAAEAAAAPAAPKRRGRAARFEEEEVPDIDRELEPVPDDEEEEPELEEIAAHKKPELEEEEADGEEEEARPKPAKAAAKAKAPAKPAKTPAKPAKKAAKPAPKKAPAKAAKKKKK